MIISSVFSSVNWIRNIKVFGQDKEPNEYWITAMVEELGELAGAVKKLKRGFNARELKKMQERYNRNDIRTLSDEALYEYWLKEKRKSIELEAADLFIYLDLFCTKNNINLSSRVAEKFNQVSEEMDCKQYQITPDGE